ncbi:MAG: UbiA prenyltransferase family protein [Candidatus Paceibacterota bacterium]
MWFHTLFLILKSARPRQWIKNIALYAPLFFSGFLFYDPLDGLPYFVIVTFAVIIFSLLTSSIYIINDVLDAKEDAKHPYKKRRPIASGELPVRTALIAAGLGLLTVFYFSMALPIFFRILLLTYLGLQLLYATKIKHVSIFDVISIALGFLIRIYAGSVVVNLHMSVWFLLTVVSASLFLAVGKRQSERTLLQNREVDFARKTLKNYSQRLLDQYTGMFANATWLTYALFSFQHETDYIESASLRFPSFYALLPRTLQSQKLLMLTLPFVIFGVMRYLQLVYEENQGESPERVLLNDKMLLTTVLIFGLIAFFVIYG